MTQQQKGGGIPILSAIGSWWGSLLGKPKMPKIPEHLVGDGDEQKSEIAAQDKGKAGDVQAVGGFAGGVTSKAGAVVSQAAKNALESVNQPLGSKVPKGSRLPKILAEMSIGAFVLLLIIGIIVFFVTRKVVSPPKDGEVAKLSPTITPLITPEPTLPIYIPGRASVYAEDEEVLKLEEDISVLERELATVNLREVGLQPPLLDFSIKF